MIVNIKTQPYNKLSVYDQNLKNRVKNTDPMCESAPEVTIGNWNTYLWDIYWLYIDRSSSYEGMNRSRLKYIKNTSCEIWSMTMSTDTKRSGHVIHTIMPCDTLDELQPNELADFGLYVVPHIEPILMTSILHHFLTFPYLIHIQDNSTSIRIA